MGKLLVILTVIVWFHNPLPSDYCIGDLHGYNCKGNDLQSCCRWSCTLNHCTGNSLTGLDLMGSANQQQHSLQDRIPIPHGYLRHILNGCVLTAVKRSYDPSRLPWSSGKGQCPSFNHGIIRLVSKSSLLHSTRLFGFFHSAFRVVIVPT